MHGLWYDYFYYYEWHRYFPVLLVITPLSPYTHPCLHVHTLVSIYTYLTQGAEFFTQETARLERMVKGGAASQAKVEEMLKKLSVLSAFSDTAEE